MKKYYLALLPLLYIGVVQAQFENWQVGNTELVAREIVDDLEIPWELLFVDDNTLWLTERQGIVWSVNIQTGNKTLLLDIKDRRPNTGDEPGLLGMVLHPDFHFSNDPKVYLVYNFMDENFDIFERLSQFSYLDGEFQNEVILIDSISGNTVHNGSRIVITDDRKILMTTGDRNTRGLSQDINSLNGKLLRINLDGSIPDDNPIPNSYVFLLGLRNSQGLVLAANGILYSTEHGPRESDEVNILNVEGNYGWPDVQGACDEADELDFCRDSMVVEPIWEWTPTVAVSDLVYYDHPNIPEFNNCLLIAVLGGFRGIPGVYQMRLSEDGLTIEEEIVHLDTLGRIRDICVNPNNGSIYIIDNGTRYPGTTPNSIIEYKPIEVATIEEEEVSVLVNYNRDQKEIIIHSNNTQLLERYEVFSISGQKVLEGEINRVKSRINISHLSPQTYIFRVFQKENNPVVKKIVW